MTDFTDGSWRSLITGDEVSAIPDSAIAQYVSTVLSKNDGDTVTTLPDNIGSNDVNGGEPKYKENIQNGNSILRYDDTDDYLNTSIPEQTIPFSVTAVCVDVDENDNNGQDQAIFAQADSTDDNYFLGWRYGGWGYVIGGAGQGAETVSPPVILTWVVQSSDSAFLRVNGSDIGASGSDSISVTSIEIGASESGTNTVLNGDIAEVVFYNDELSSAEIDSEEQRLADVWGITI